MLYRDRELYRSDRRLVLSDHQPDAVQGESLEEAQLMASMGLPLAFGSTSSQRSEVSGSLLLRSFAEGVFSCSLWFFTVLFQPKRKSATYWRPPKDEEGSEEEEQKEEVKEEEEGSACTIEGDSTRPQLSTSAAGLTPVVLGIYGTTGVPVIPDFKVLVI